MDSRARGRLLFAMDATASRQPHWDSACHLQSQLFSASADLGGLDVQLCYYRGFNEFHYSPWYNNSQPLLTAMNSVCCLGGHTQIGRVLKHAQQQHRQQPMRAVVIAADALEENLDQLCHLAGQLGLLQLPLLMLQDGHDPVAKRGYQQLAKLSGGAYFQLDNHSAKHLADFFAAAATFASGGKSALKTLNSPAAKSLLTQLK
jgi:hypothetical protein